MYLATNSHFISMYILVVKREKTIVKNLLKSIYNIFENEHKTSRKYTHSFFKGII